MVIIATSHIITKVIKTSHGIYSGKLMIPLNQFTMLDRMCSGEWSHILNVRGGPTHFPKYRYIQPVTQIYQSWNPYNQYCSHIIEYSSRTPEVDMGFVNLEFIGNSYNAAMNGKTDTDRKTMQYDMIIGKHQLEKIIIRKNKHF